MSTTQIPYSQATNTGKELAQFVNDALELKGRATRMGALLNTITSGSDWPALAAELSLTNTQAQDTWTIVSTAVSSLAGAAVSELSRLDQG